MKENEELLTDKEIQDRMDELSRNFRLRRYRIYKILFFLFGIWIVFCFLFNFPDKLGSWLNLPELARFPVNALIIIFSIALWWFFWFGFFWVLNLIITIPQTKKWLRLEKIQHKRSKEKK